MIFLALRSRIASIVPCEGLWLDPCAMCCMLPLKKLGQVLYASAENLGQVCMLPLLHYDQVLHASCATCGQVSLASSATLGQLLDASAATLAKPYVASFLCNIRAWCRRLALQH